MNINRQPAGQPTGGQFAESARAGAGIALGGETRDYRQRWTRSGSSDTLVDPDGNEMPLNDIVEWDSAFRVNPNGTVDTGVDSHIARDLQTIAENTGADEFDDVPEAVTGHSGQHGYSGPIMHPSEQLAGGMADHVLSRPGTYMLSEAQDFDDPDNLAGWVLLRREV